MGGAKPGRPVRTPRRTLRRPAHQTAEMPPIVAKAERPLRTKRARVFGGAARAGGGGGAKQSRLVLTPRPSHETAVSAVVTSVALNDNIDTATSGPVPSHNADKTRGEAAIPTRREQAEKVWSGIERGLIRLVRTPTKAWADAPPGLLVVLPGAKGHRKYIYNIRNRLKATGFTFNPEKKLWWLLKPPGYPDIDMPDDGKDSDDGDAGVTAAVVAASKKE